MYDYRPLHSGDLELVCSHRERMFIEAGHDQGIVGEMTSHFRPWLERCFRERQYFGIAAELDGRVVASIGMTTMSWPPHPLHARSDARGYVLNLYVEPDHRGRRLGRRLVDLAERELAARGIAYAFLHTTAAARTMYEKLGWRATNELAKRIEWA